MSVESIQAKSAIVEEIKEKLSRAQSAVVIDYMGINVVEADAMRKQLREAGVDYKVYKNTLVKRAIEGTQFEGLAEVLEGPSAFAFGYEDATAPARELNSVIKKINKMEFKAGVVEGQFYDKDGITTIAQLPSRDELIAKLPSEASSLLYQASLIHYRLLLIRMRFSALNLAPKCRVQAPAEEAAPAAE